ncbi:Zn-dependent exopeptidase [Basidiobolus meristosporus CBS 931.73]|uniref:Peptide hydrolase n=1 Tax=Basidiobolus meristosporus CBS 931.73 TaxID=1314790 RepID=A0A1Y1YBI2_9FUNG|nr:Zn-dependent exopeptidase [Basidiobolus meristosporus CBS 931.73]|eukprot:ORX95275.1 Zn-dependent exopeptidase [Basidiobolus meristosporus CBS 931.73]
MTDLYGARPTGSKNLEDSIDWIVRTIRKEDKNLTVTTQNVKVDVWHRQEESLSLFTPTRGKVDLDVKALGRSAETGRHGLTAEVIVVSGSDELESLKDKVKGKIVLFNNPFTTYGKSVGYRSKGAVIAEKYGAIAALVRSVTPFSLNTIHIGSSTRATIPSAAISLEDANLLGRMYNRSISTDERYANKKLFPIPRVNLRLRNTYKPLSKVSRNIIVEVKGREKPDEIVVIGGHIDSWDIGVGAMDDGGGAFTGWEALRLISELPTRPRRTVRAVFWVDEENGGAGSRAYFEHYKNEIDKHVFALESDSGNFKPWGISFQGSDAAQQAIARIGAEYLSSLSAGNVVKGGAGADVSNLCAAGVPCGEFVTADHITGLTPDAAYQKGYFYYHHSAGDRMEALNPDDLSANAATMATWAYVIAEQEEVLPRTSVKLLVQ